MSSPILEPKARIVHDIRNPLASVKLALQLMGRTNLDDRARKNLSLALREVRAMERILLAVAASGAPAPEESETMDLASGVIAPAVEAAGGERSLRGVTLSVDLGDTPVRVVGAPEQMVQAMEQLLCEVARAHPDTRTTVTLVRDAAGLALRVTPAPRETLCITFARQVFGSLELDEEGARVALREAR